MKKETFLKKFKEMDTLIRNLAIENIEMKERIEHIEDILKLNEIHQNGGDIEKESGGDWGLVMEEEPEDEEAYIEAMQNKDSKPTSFEDEFELPDLSGINKLERQIKAEKLETPAINSAMKELKNLVAKNKPR